MKQFWKRNKWLAVYLIGSLGYVSSQIQTGHYKTVYPVLILIPSLLLYLYWADKNRK
ncbi:hypothetical protein [Streptococcus chenjunshii]|uniref:hypothetical protein n=1 Tax=Streptococcus chenjunshii TaxID=2173853 RepID=UPI0013C358AC|nr:hypothetical protein [Streptococcus chenjunshii]